MSKHVFISHAHKDSAAANAVVAALEQRSVTCWIAPRNVPPGGSYAEAILTAIEGASCFVLIYSEHSNFSSHVLREVERALKFGVNIVPVRFDDSTPSKSLDYLLATVHWLSIPSESREHSIAKAAEQIAGWLTNFLKDPAAPLPAKITAGQNGRVTALELPRKSNRLLISSAVIAILVTAGIFAADRLPFFDKTQPQTVSSEKIVPTEVPPELRLAPVQPAATPRDEVAPGVKRQIGYAGVSSPALPRPNPPGSSLYNGGAIQPPPPQHPGVAGQAENYRPPPPPPRGPNFEGEFGNGPGPNGPPAGRFPPPPGPGGPMGGPPHGTGPNGPRPPGGPGR